ncbi:1-aminocyclopropane-1-carboxylate deaminase/D-cysteine desulfhydrase [Hymenobacter properus]|uniref:1-aminocyclopropane-1-carboxylate deaminase/D-cysteine desulfhydrase n=1 Tax=Hymenobacter properus TaxID=2791026 RepID=A0A931BI04_9BACT|nr:pyridoxal-phosphate dependent enzyme [Hymenobacter properus]MBF9142851.1 1-aminocyclopropane-1-carboxylate deaminase/D-cysteine desulfhydrase [Hymenobacter properus]MBR7721660.1 1-aminocyclopropane-1-carboxylate deaminase/D-cysteine desulfhydrase [Microvirga sp. SRT04]
MNELLQELNEPVAVAQGVRLLLWRDDLAHPDLPGNKARKLKYNLQAARAQGHDTLLTFGGAYSNHLAAVATAGRLLGFRTFGLVRGDAPTAGTALNPTLTQAAADGMDLHYLDRSTYRRRAEPDFLAEVQARFGPAYVLPEGGTNALALHGCAELASEIRAQVAFDTLALAVGTGGTLAGLLTGLRGPEQALGVAALKNGSFLRAEVDELTQQAAGQAFANYSLQTDYHFGGYAKYSAELLAFIKQFRLRHGVLLDPIYTSKMMFGVLDLIRQGHFARGSTVVAIHTGGQQAWAGWQQRFGRLGG